MNARPWSLARRITLWCTLVGVGFVSLLAAVGILLVHHETNLELDAIASEELEEMIGAFANTSGTPDDFAAACHTLQLSHPDDSMAWRVWRRADGTPWGTFGREHVRALLPAEARTEPTLGRFLRWRAAPLDDALEVGLLLEGGREVASERLFILVALSTVAGASVLSYAAGRALGQRVGRTLRETAERTRSAVHAADLGDSPADLPEELLDVVAALRGALQRIREESDRARLLAAGLAHELRSPLQNLLTAGEVTLLRERAPVEYQAAIGRQLVDLRELARAVDNLVTLCAPPETRTRKESFDLAEQARLRLEPDLQRAAQAGVQVVLSFPAALPFVGDRETIVLALRNLLANAIDWSPPGGRVELAARASGAHWELEVDDQGPGVPPQDRERIFRPFERGAPRPDGRVGYGLGLALVRTVAEMHGGAVEVAVSPAGGARFRLTLPRNGMKGSS